MREIKEPEWPEKNDLDRIYELYGERAGNILDYCEGENEMRESCIKAFKAWQEGQGEYEPPLNSEELKQALENCAFIAKKMEEQEELYFKKRKELEAQAGEYIKQAVYNGYSLKSDKPPLSALDESEVNDWFAEHFSDTDKKYYDTDLAKKFCEQFGTPPVKKVSVKELQKVVEEYYRKQHEVGDTIKMKSIHTFDIAQSIVDYLEGKGGR